MPAAPLSVKLCGSGPPPVVSVVEAGLANALVLVTAGIVLTSVQALLPVTSR